MRGAPEFANLAESTTVGGELMLDSVDTMPEIKIIGNHL
jgi:hypothetical protein